MPAFNSVTLLGNLTRTPELRYTPSGAAVCDLGLAVNRKYTTAGGEKREEVLFVTCVAWGKTGENCAEHLDKGSLVLINGRLQSRQWEKEGQKRTTIEVVVDTVQFLSFKDGGRDSGNRPQRPQEAGARPAGDDDVPF